MPEFSEKFQIIKNSVDITDVAVLLGAQNLKRCGCGKSQCNCMFHDEKTGSMMIYEKTNSFNCFGCGTGGDVITLVQKALDMPKAIDAARWLDAQYNLGVIDRDNYDSQWKNALVKSRQKAEERAKRSYPDEETHDYTDYFKKVSQNIANTDYHRGLSIETLKKFNIGFDPEWKHPRVLSSPKGQYVPSTPRLIIPTSSTSYLARDVRPNIPDKQAQYSKSKVGNVHIFNERALQESKKPIFIVEGEIDAMSICDVGGEAIGIGGVGNAQNLVEKLAKANHTQPFIICMDNDKAGLSAVKVLEEGFNKNGIIYRTADIASPHKDANEALIANREIFEKKVRFETAKTMFYAKSKRFLEERGDTSDVNKTFADYLHYIGYEIDRDADNKFILYSFEKQDYLRNNSGKICTFNSPAQIVTNTLIPTQGVDLETVYNLTYKQSDSQAEANKTIESNQKEQ